MALVLLHRIAQILIRTSNKLLSTSIVHFSAFYSGRDHKGNNTESSVEFRAIHPASYAAIVTCQGTHIIFEDIPMARRQCDYLKYQILRQLLGEFLPWHMFMFLWLCKGICVCVCKGVWVSYHSLDRHLWRQLWRWRKDHRLLNKGRNNTRTLKHCFVKKPNNNYNDMQLEKRIYLLRS